MESYAFPAPTVDEGDEMVDGLLYDAEGGKHHLSELKGRYILLDFWSVACGPCRMAEPELKEIAEIYVDKLALVGICTDDKERWTTFLTEHEMPGRHPLFCTDSSRREDTGDMERLSEGSLEKEVGETGICLVKVTL